MVSNLIADDSTAALHIYDYEFCNQLFNKLNRALVSTSANMSAYPIPKSFKEISKEVLKGVYYVVNLHQEKSSRRHRQLLNYKHR